MMSSESDKVYLPQTRCSCETMPMGMEGALALAGEHIGGPDARILAEMPERVLWQPFNNDSNEDLLPLLKNCLKLYIFDANAEVRLQRENGRVEGIGRLARLNEEAAPTYTRFSEYWIAGSKGRLRYAEHFAFKNGVMTLRFARYCGLARAFLQ